MKALAKRYIERETDKLFGKLSLESRFWFMTGIINAFHRVYYTDGKWKTHPLVHDNERNSQAQWLQ